MDKKIIWIGNRESEIRYSNLCNQSITRYGTNQGNNISNSDSSKWDINFVMDELDKNIEDENYVLFFYSNYLANTLIKKASKLKDHVINRFDSYVLNIIDDKTYSHLWASNYLPVIEFTEMFGIECNYKNIKKNFRCLISLLFKKIILLEESEHFYYLKQMNMIFLTILRNILAIL